MNSDSSVSAVHAAVDSGNDDEVENDKSKKRKKGEIFLFTVNSMCAIYMERRAQLM